LPRKSVQVIIETTHVDASRPEELEEAAARLAAEQEMPREA
jgi:hypothetical protein